LKKIEKILILLFIIIMISAMSVIVILLNINGDNHNHDAEDLIYGDVEEVTNATTFYNVENCINEYFQKIYLGDIQAIKEISQQNIIPIQSYNSRPIFHTIQMYSIDRVYNITVFVYGNLRIENIQTQIYLIVNLDYDNKAFQIKMSSEEEYENAKENRVLQKYKEDIIIEKKQHNILIENKLTNIDILNRYYEDYKFNMFNDKEEAFRLLDNDYREKKFDNNIENYKKYVENIKDKVVDTNIVKYGVSQKDMITEYVGIDNNGNYYKFIENGLNKYTIILDNYTIQNKEEEENYNKLSAKEKISYNISKIFKLINERDYLTLYSYFNEEYKRSVFKDEQQFINYMENTFFENNIIGAVDIQMQSDTYAIVDVPYKENLSTVAREKKIRIIIKVKDSMKFEMSFAM
jgi:hypothetical protein